jgi:SEC-C motif
MIVGRNDRCPCGSGKKYKHCHLDADRHRERVETELGQMIFHDLPTTRMALATRKPGFAGEVTATAELLNSAFREEIGNGLDGQQAAEALENYMERVESAMAEIAAGHSRGYWMHMTRRLPPLPLGGASRWTVLLYRRVLTLAALKYGGPAVREGEFTMIETQVGNQQVPAALDHAAIVDVFALEYLAFEYTTATQAYRRVGKGSRLVILDEDFAAVADDELEDLIQDVDRRVGQYGELTGKYGAVTDRDFPLDLPEGGHAPLAVLATTPNTDRIASPKAMRSKGINVPGPTNFLAHPVVIDGYREALSSLAAEVEQALGVPPDVLLSVVWSLSMYLVRGIEASPAVEVQLLKTGYLVSKRGEDWARLTLEVSRWVSVLMEHFGHERSDDEQSRELTEAGIGALTWSKQKIASISLWDRLPFNLITDAGEFFLIDYSVLAAMFADIFRQVGFLSGASGNVKAANFEAAVAARGTAEGFVPWKHRVELYHHDGTCREIDAGFIAGDVLYIVECKAYAQNPRIDRGDWAARLSRQDQLLTYLDQARTLAEFIDAERIGRNYQVPQQITRVEHLLCTPGVEFIWGREPHLWLTDEIPRICTVDELMIVLKATSG